MSIQKRCLNCNSSFTTYNHLKDRKKYCCRNCFTQYKKIRFAGINNPFYGKKHTEEVKERISNLAKGNTRKRGKKVPSMKGDNNPAKRPEIRLKISINRKLAGFPDWQKDISLKNLEQTRTKWSIEKMRISKTGKPNFKLRGANNNFWKGGISTQNDIIKHSLEYKLFIKTCYLRDDYKCKRCRIYSGKLNVHHIKNFSQYPKLRTLPINGITLCLYCHKQFHKQFGFRNNTVRQIKYFIS